MLVEAIMSNKIIIHRLYRPLRARTYQPCTGLTWTCAETEVNGQSVSLGATYGQHVKFPTIVVFIDMIITTDQ